MIGLPTRTAIVLSALSAEMILVAAFSFAMGGAVFLAKRYPKVPLRSWLASLGLLAHVVAFLGARIALGAVPVETVVVLILGCAASLFVLKCAKWSPPATFFSATALALPWISLLLQFSRLGAWS